MQTNSPPKQNKQDSHISSISPPFCHVLTKITQTKSKQKTYTTKEKRKQRNNESSSIENIGNSPYEEQQLPLRTTKVFKKKLFSPYKNRKNKTCFGKNNFGENLGGGENNDTQIKLKKN